jgi:hypothetical protein
LCSATITLAAGPAGLSVIVMLSLIVFFARRKRAYVWSPALDLSDPHVAAALVPMIHG